MSIVALPVWKMQKTVAAFAFAGAPPVVSAADGVPVSVIVRASDWPNAAGSFCLHIFFPVGHAGSPVADPTVQGMPGVTKAPVLLSAQNPQNTRSWSLAVPMLFMRTPVLVVVPVSNA